MLSRLYNHLGFQNNGMIEAVGMVCWVDYKPAALLLDLLARLDDKMSFSEVEYVWKI